MKTRLLLSGLVLAGGPRLLAIDAHVELRDLAFIRRRRLGHPRHGTHRLQYLLGRQLQACRLRPLHVDLDRLAEAAEDRR